LCSTGNLNGMHIEIITSYINQAQHKMNMENNYKLYKSSITQNECGPGIKIKKSDMKQKAT